MKTQLFNRLLLGGCLLLSTFACNKNEDGDLTDWLTDAHDSTPNIIMRGGTNRFDDDRPIVLGDQLPNPYAVEVMTTAYNRLYEPDVTMLPPTHHYIRCLPRTLEEVAILEKLPLDWFDVPLDYEIAEMGTYYQDPTVNDPQYTWIYTVVPVGFVLPSTVQHQVLSKLLIAPYRSFLTREAYLLVGAPYHDDWSATYRLGDCIPTCENYPDCLLSVNIPCNDPVSPPPNNGNPLPEPPCHVGMDNWPECLTIPVEQEPPPGVTAPPPGNICQCPLNSNPSKPSGRIQVQDTQIGNSGCMVGVRRVKVRIMENLFQWHHVYTDDMGCFKSDNYVSGGLYFLNLGYGLSLKTQELPCVGYETSICSIIATL